MSEKIEPAQAAETEPPKTNYFPVWPPPPVMYGDGIHDDAEALQAFLDGRPFLDKRTGEINRGAALRGGVHRVGRSMDIALGPRRDDIADAVFITDPDVEVFMYKRSQGRTGYRDEVAELTGRQDAR